MAFALLVPYMASITTERLSGCAHNPISIPVGMFLPPRDCKREEPLSGHFITFPIAPPLVPFPFSLPLLIDIIP